MTQIEQIKAELESTLKSYEREGIYDRYEAGERDAYQSLLSFIESLEQEPAVDLEKEVQSFWNANALEYRLGHIADINFLAYTARHFFELGLSVRKEARQ